MLRYAAARLRTVPLLTGDNRAAAGACGAAQVGIDSAVADMLPKSKIRRINGSAREKDIPSPWSVTASATVPR